MTDLATAETPAAVTTSNRFHALANAFPLITGAEFDELVEDIKVNGILQPVVIHEGKILDGRNRWRACQQLGIPHTEVKYKGSDPAAFVWGINAVRRQLTPSQKAMAATKLVTAKAGRPVKGGESVTTAAAAKMAGVGQRTTERARKVIENAVPEVVAAVESGELTLSTAERVSEIPKETQKKIMAETPVKEIVKVVPDTRPTRTPKAVVDPFAGPEPTKAEEAAPAVSRAAGPKVKLTRYLEQSSSEGAKLRTKTWAELKDTIPELDPGLLAGFVKDLRAEGRAIAQLIKLIELKVKEAGEK